MHQLAQTPLKTKGNPFSSAGLKKTEGTWSLRLFSKLTLHGCKTREIPLAAIERPASIFWHVASSKKSEVVRSKERSKFTRRSLLGVSVLFRICWLWAFRSLQEGVCPLVGWLVGLKHFFLNTILEFEHKKNTMKTAPDQMRLHSLTILDASVYQ